MADVYDRMRQPMGIDVIAGLLQNIHLLDAGCGTGHYAKPLLEMGLGKITLLDVSSDMLAVAKEKLDGAIKDGRAHIIHVRLPRLPFQDSSFDAVMFILSLNHLDEPGADQNFPNMHQTLANTRRILRRGGLLIVSTVLSTTVRDSMWCFQLNQAIKDKHVKASMPVRQYMEIFDKHRFRCVSVINLLATRNTNIFHDYLNPEGPLIKEWCQATNLFDLAAESEIRETKSFITDMKQNNELLKFVRENDHTHERGLVTLFACISEP